MAWQSLRALGAIGAAGIWFGCLSTTVDNSGPRSVGAVQGRVMKVDGSPVQGALLLFTVTTVPVGGVSQLIGSTSLLSAQDGSYVQPFLVQVDPGAFELEIQVTPPIGSLLSPADTAAIPLLLEGSSPPRDTAFVNITLHGR
jgi:hypothetical protein